MTPLYFGYGSNLNVPVFHTWCARRGFSDARLVPHALGHLPEMKLCFNYHSPGWNGAAANIMAAAGQRVPGALYTANERTWEALDRKEGVRQGRYERYSVRIIDGDGEEVQAVTYRVTSAFMLDSPIPPGPGYADMIRAGLMAHGLPTKHLVAAEAEARST